jgi:uncharacterized protein
MWTPVREAAFLAAAGVLAGTAGSAGAIGSLISYPALLLVGIPALPANVTNAVAVVGSGLGSSSRSRVELRGTGARVRRWALLTAAGAAVGATLLLLTSDGVFQWVVPFLVASAAVLLWLQPRIESRRLARGHTTHRLVLPGGLFAVALYEGYFGAASGVMTLALLMLTVENKLPRANALKNLLLGVADVVAALAFTVFGPVSWLAAVPLGLGFVVGGLIGPSVTRRVPAEILRVVISIAGLCLAVWLLIRAIRG